LTLQRRPGPLDVAALLPVPMLVVVSPRPGDRLAVQANLVAGGDVLGDQVEPHYLAVAEGDGAALGFDQPQREVRVAGVGAAADPMSEHLRPEHPFVAVDPHPP